MQNNAAKKKGKIAPLSSALGCLGEILFFSLMLFIVLDLENI